MTYLNKITEIKSDTSLQVPILSICEKSSLSHYHKKKVRFLKNPEVVMIPTRNTFIPLFSDLWWNEIELQTMKNEAYAEMREYLYLNNCDIKQGIKKYSTINDSFSIDDTKLNTDTFLRDFSSSNKGTSNCSESRQAYHVNISQSYNINENDNYLSSILLCPIPKYVKKSIYIES